MFFKIGSLIFASTRSSFMILLSFCLSFYFSFPMGGSRFSFKIFEEISQSIPDNAEHKKKKKKKKKKRRHC